MKKNQLDRYRFRAIDTKLPFKDGVSKEMVYFEIDETDNAYIICSRTYLEGRYILMQNSTIRDAEGTFIYDGDIISAQYRGSRVTLPVIFIKGMFAVKYPDGRIESLYGLSKKTDVVVRGNIHENPGLLEQPAD